MLTVSNLIITVRPRFIIRTIFRTRDRRGRYCMVVGFATIYAISAYHH